MQNKSIIKQNILQFIDAKGIKKPRFYEQTGITRGILDQNNGMSEDNIAKFLSAYPEVNANWLLKGSGEMIIIENNSDNILQEIQTLNEEDQKSLYKIIDLFIKDSKSKN